MKKRIFFAGCLVMLLLISGCKSKTLDLASFGDVVSDHDIRVLELNISDSRVARWSTARSDSNDIVIQFVETNSVGDAASLYNEQVAYFKNNCETEAETGSQASTKYTLTAGGFYYEVDCCKQYVIIVSCSKQNRAEAQEIISELPEL